MRLRTVRGETTKDKARTLPPAVHSNAKPNATARVFFPSDRVEQTPTASSEMRSVVSDVSVLSFVSSTTNLRVNCRFQPGPGCSKGG